MAFTRDYRLTDQIRALGHGLWDGYISERWMEERRLSGGRFEVLLFVKVRTCYPFEGWSPPDELTLRWHHKQAPEPGVKVRVLLAHAFGFSRPATWLDRLEFADGSYLPQQYRYVIDGEWDVLLIEENADAPHVVTATS